MCPASRSLKSAVSSSLARATSKAKANVTLLSVAMLICCWAWGLQPAVAQSAFDGFEPSANGPVVAVVQPAEKILIAGGFTTLMPNGGSAVKGNRIAGLESDGAFTLTASPSTVNPGEAINVTWTAPDGRPANDWIGLYKVGDPDTSYRAWHYTPGTSSGVIFFTAPSQTGQYEFRYFTDNSYNRVATSNPVTVVEVEVTFSLNASPNTPDPGAVITVMWTAPDGRPANDWLGLYKVGDPDTGYTAWHYTAGAPSGSTTFTAPSQAGQYEFRYFTNNSYNRVATSNPLMVGAGNYPDASVPLSTDTTVTPNAAPINTTSINVATSTNFKGKLEGDPATGVVRVTDAHPAGTYTVTVRGFNSGGATTTKTFELTVTTPATCTPVSFAAAATFVHVANPNSVAVGDFNGDGKQDLVVANSGPVGILLGDGAGSFGTTTNFGVGVFANSVAVGDFNGDGQQDLAVAGFSVIPVVPILLGDGTGSFSAATNFGVGGSPVSLAVGDFNGDGQQDLAVANANSANVSILLGDGAGSFSAATNFGVGADPRSVAVGDFNGDGKQDLAVANRDSLDVTILVGDGTGTFTLRNIIGTGGKPYSVAVGDFNSDGKQDLAVSTGDFEASGRVEIKLGNGTGGFGTVASLDVGAPASPTSVAVGDFNGDGQQDLAVAVIYNSPRGLDNVSILLRDCATTPPTYALTASPLTVFAGETINVTWTAPDGRSANDWIGLYKVGDPDMSFSAWQYTAGAPSGSTTLTAPSQTGWYEFRYFTNNSYTKVATSNKVTVVH